MFDSGHHLVLKSHKTLTFGDRTSHCSDSKNTDETYSFGHDGKDGLSLGLGN